MLDITGNIDLSKNNFIFYSIGGSNPWQTWIKPRGIKFVHFIVIGSGGGGGRGNGSLLNSGTGGGGGGTGGITTGFFPASTLPDRLYIQVGLAGSAGIAGAGGNGALSYVSTLPSQTAINQILASGAVAATGGGAGGSSIQGTAGAGSTVFSQAGRPYSYLGIVNSVAGQSGGVGGSVTPTPGDSITLTLPITGGAGGGSLDLSSNGTSGGTIVGSGFVPSVIGSPVVTTNYIRSSGSYASFYNFNGSVRNPLFFCGGNGGGAATDSTFGLAGDGGNASIGSGGGGGGASNTSSSDAGFGGLGGNGIVIITCC